MRWFDPDDWQEMGDVLRANPLRTLLTMAGVFWGTLVLVLMLGFSEGLEAGAMRLVGGTTTNAVYVWGGRTRLPYKGLQPGRGISYDVSDTPVLAALSGVKHVAPRNQLGGYRDGAPVVRGEHSGAFQVMADVPVMAQILTVLFDRGRFLDDLDLKESRKVAVIGREVHKALYPDGEDPLGTYIRIRGVYFQVIGLFHSRSGGDAGDRSETTIHVPFTTFQRAFNTGDAVAWFAVVGRDDVSASELETRVKATLAERHDVHPDDAQNLGSFNAEAEFERVQSLFVGIRALTWLVGAATVLSGAVGVSNVLLIVVRERTMEIGVRRAVGATAGSIVRMIVGEALVITGVAGLGGLCTGVAIVAAAAQWVGPDSESFGAPRVDPWAALIGFGLLLVAGGVASVLPARRAVAIEPVAALRTE
ncbi:MAG: ABC transporter permease [Myxococcota bacterium]